MQLIFQANKKETGSVHGKTDDAVDKTRFILIYRKGVLLD
jgi:hypothetical protein